MKRAPLLLLVPGLMVLAPLVACEPDVKKQTITTCQLDEGPELYCLSPVKYDDLPPGRHTVTVRATTYTYQGQGKWTASKTGTDQRSWTVAEP